MTILTTTELREHIETDLGDDALQRLADDAESLIIATAGETGSRTENFNAFGFPSGRDRVIFAALAIDTITSINERDDLDGDPTTLSSDDWEKQGKRQLFRLGGGTNPRSLWAQHVTLIYQPVVDTTIRKMVQVDLVKLENMFSGAAREEQGDFEVWHKASDDATKILARLKTSNNELPIA